VRTGLAFVCVLAVAACGGGTATNTPTTPPGINFAMTAQNASKVSGTGQIVQGTGSFTVTIKLTGLAPGSSHVSHLHAGSCAAPGGIAYALQEVIADSSGAATATSTVLTTYAIPGSGWYVNVHHGPDFTESEYAPSDSCGDLSAA
jgi:CHRD domain